MEIEFKRSDYYTYLIYTDVNVRVEDQVSTGGPLENEIATNTIDKFVGVLDDLIYFRQKEYDSTNIISNLFDKLPEEKQQTLLKKFNEDYGD